MSLTPLKNHTFTIVDVATTGFRAETDEPVEIAAIKLQNGVVMDHRVWRVQPSVKIPPQASAVHELRDADVAGCPTLAEVESDIQNFVGKSTVVMHNLVSGEPLDKAMLPCLSANTWICNARLAKHLWPQTTQHNGVELMNYDVWTLTYWQNRKGLDTFGAQVYQPLAFAAATAHVFQEGLNQYLAAGHEPTVEGLCEFTEKPVQLKIWPMGEFRDVKVANIEDKSLGRMLKNARNNDEFDPDLLFTLEEETDRRLKARNNSGVRRFTS
jgi:DNA polymerase III epsilon subunit-like protein